MDHHFGKFRHFSVVLTGKWRFSFSDLPDCSLAAFTGGTTLRKRIVFVLDFFHGLPYNHF
jgi:hypothetical protein